MALTDEQWEELRRGSAAAIGRALAQEGWPTLLDNGGLILPDSHLLRIQQEAEEEERKRLEQAEIYRITQMSMAEYAMERDELLRQAGEAYRAGQAWASWGSTINKPTNWKPIEVDEEGNPVDPDDIDESLICIWCGEVQTDADALELHEDECAR